MAASQHHGFVFEQHVRQEVDRRLGPNARPPAGFQADPTARFDLPAWRDPTGQGIPTSIKVAKRPGSNRVRVDLADARRTVALAEVPMLRLLVGIYGQKGQEKVVDEVREYLIPGECWAQATGEVPPATVARFHDSLKIGAHQQARERAREWKQALARDYPGIVRWSPKIDSKHQRRLQAVLGLPGRSRCPGGRPPVRDRERLRPRWNGHPGLFGQAVGPARPCPAPGHSQPAAPTPRKGN
jgi:hypothetical protein